MYFRSVLLFLFSISLAVPVSVFGDDPPPAVPAPSIAGTVSTQKYAFDFDGGAQLGAATASQPTYPAGHPDSLGGAADLSTATNADGNCVPCNPSPYAANGNYGQGNGKYVYPYPGAYNQNYYGYGNNYNNHIEYGNYDNYQSNYYGGHCNNNILGSIIGGLFSGGNSWNYADCRKTTSTPYNIVPSYDEEGLLPGYMKRFGRQWYIDGWVQGGYMNAPVWPDDNSNDPVRYTDRVNEGVLNQAYLTFGREVDRKGCGIDIGGRVDVFYGADYLWTSALGLETYRYNSDGETVTAPRTAVQHWNKNAGKVRAGNLDAAYYGVSLPQAYLELYVPIMCGFTAKAGHFYSPMGYESAMAPENFFYSHSYSFMYGEPTTLSGVLFNQKLNRRLSLTAGVTHGWDQWENPNDRVSYLAGLHWESCDTRTNFDFHIMSGRAEMREGTRTNYSAIFTHKFTPRLRYALQHDLGIGENGAEGVYEIISNSTKYVDSKWYSVAQYLYYDYSETLSFGLRAEWFRDENNARIMQTAGQYEIFGTPLFGTEGSDYYQVSFGANWRPAKYITIRPEVRYDWSDVKITDGVNPSYSYNNGLDKDIVTVGLDAIIKF